MMEVTTMFQIVGVILFVGLIAFAVWSVLNK